MVEERTLKTAAKEAKLRLKSGFWQKYKEDIKLQVDKNRASGVCATDVINYYSGKIEGLSQGKEDSFYLKVKKILDQEGEVSDILGRLTDESIYSSMGYEAKQRYMLSLSDRYQKALLRYKKEQTFQNTL